MEFKINFKNKKQIIYFFYITMIITIAPFVLSLIHELGHFIIAKIFGWEIIEIVLSYFPIFNNAYISTIIPELTPIWQEVLFYSFGSIFSLIIGSIVFYLIYKFKYHHYIELGLFAYSVSLILDIFMYILLDIFILKIGDWYKIYLINSFYVFIFLIIEIIILIYGIKNKEKIIDNISDLE